MKIKIGQIGIGHNHGAAKMEAVLKRPDLFEVIGYAEENEEWIRRRGTNAPYRDLPRKSVEEILSEADAILVETDVWDLTRTAKRCVSAGKHIHLDKPASGTPEEFSEVLDIARRGDLVVQMGYMYRYNPAVMEAIRMYREGKLGQIVSINAEMSTFHSPEYKTWLKNFPGGIMYILGSHLIDLCVYLCGKPTSVTSFFKHTGLDGVDLDDCDLTVLAYPRALCRVFVSSCEVNGWGRRQFVISGTRGTVDIKPIENDCTAWYSDLGIADNPYEDRKRALDVSDVPKNCRYDLMMEDFYLYITKQKENPFTYEHEDTVHRVICEAVGGVSEHGKI